MTPESEAPSEGSTASSKPSRRVGDLSTSTLQFFDAGHPHKSLADHIPLMQRPCILVLGGEGKGLRRPLVAHADYLVSMIPPLRARADDVGVDSLNVSVATAVLAAEFLRRPVQAVLDREAKRRTSGGDLGF